MKRLAEQLRASHPNPAQVRLRRALSKKGVRIFQLVGVLQGGQKIARKLDASDELGALVAAQKMMSTVGDTGVMSTGRVSAAGQLKVIQKIAI